MQCPYCGSGVKLVDGATIYGGRRPDLALQQFLACERYPACDAYVGCHPDTGKPCGRLADKELRQWKRRAHDAFDPLWRRKAEKLRREDPAVSFNRARKEARRLAYQWLSGQLGLSRGDCHIGEFGVTLCRRVVELCEPYRRKLA
jgi:hypothetical protein